MNDPNATYVGKRKSSWLEERGVDLELHARLSGEDIIRHVEETMAFFYNAYEGMDERAKETFHRGLARMNRKATPEEERLIFGTDSI